MKPKDRTMSLGLDLGDPTRHFDAEGKELCYFCRTSTNPNHLCLKHKYEWEQSKKKSRRFRDLVQRR